MQKRVILGFLLALGACGSAFAQDPFSYSYAELGYISSESGNIDGDGANLFGSLALTDMLHGFGSYSDQDFDFGVGVEFLQLGAGVNFAIASNLDLVARLSYVEVQVDGPGFSVDDSGLALGGFLRARPSEKFEISAGLNYQELDDGGEDTSLQAGIRYYLTQKLAAGFDLIENDGDSSYILGARYDFAR